MSRREFPSDVHTESLCRLPLVKREDLNDGAKGIFDDHNDPNGSSHAGMRGPGGVRLHSPRLAEFSRRAAQYLRHETGLNPRIREVAILVSAREHNSQFEWQQHERVGLREGVSPETIDVIKHRKPVDGLDGTEALIIEIGRQLFREHKLSSDLFAKARETFGEQKLIDLLANMGSYAATAMLLAAVDMQVPLNEEILLPVP
ncbi:carboxymuconolactone decarboxylase family protein [Alphaproteobacteria bacterium]|nr:carboxymuconolactone decarboxylase family protein [Alphaproteobacteria bacterium]